MMIDRGNERRCSRPSARCLVVVCVRVQNASHFHSCRMLDVDQMNGLGKKVDRSVIAVWRVRMT